jgi:hypothetical protein
VFWVVWAVCVIYLQPKKSQKSDAPDEGQSAY